MVSRGIGSILFTALIVMVSACGKEPASAPTAVAAAVTPSGPAEVALAFRKQWQKIVEDSGSRTRTMRLRVTADKLHMDHQCVREMPDGTIRDVTAHVEVPIVSLSSNTVRVSESFYSSPLWFTTPDGTQYFCELAMEAGEYEMRLSTDQQSAIGLYLNNVMKFHYYKLPGT